MSRHPFPFTSLRSACVALATAVMCFSSASPLFAQKDLPPAEALTRLDQSIESYMEEREIPGFIYALASDGEVILARSFGMADVELAVPVNEQHVFEIGSISKQFVSATIMLMVEDGLIGLDDPVQKYLPEIPGEWFGVTIHQLLTHTSGIPDYEEIRGYDVYRFRLTPEEIIQIAHSRPMDFPPGTGYYYSNTGYFLLSRIVETVAGQPLDAALQKRIFEPLGMSQTRMADPEDIIPHRASGYWINRTGTLINRPPTESSSTLGAGGLLSSVGDMAIWAEALDGESLLSDESKRRMWTPVRVTGGEKPRRQDGTTIEYGYGWSLGDYRGSERQSHWGQVAGFTAHFSRFPEQNLAVIVFLNRYQAGAGPIVDEIIDTLIPGLE